MRLEQTIYFRVIGKFLSEKLKTRYKSGVRRNDFEISFRTELEVQNVKAHLDNGRCVADFCRRL